LKKYQFPDRTACSRLFDFNALISLDKTPTASSVDSIEIEVKKSDTDLCGKKNYDRYATFAYGAIPIENKKKYEVSYSCRPPLKNNRRGWRAFFPRSRIRYA
jgi:hypothetical protein